MKTFVAALVLSALVASPAMAAKAPECKTHYGMLLPLLNALKTQVDDLQAKAITEPKAVARAVKIINSAPPVTHSKGDELVFIFSPSAEKEDVLLVDHGCIQERLAFRSMGEMAAFVDHIRKDPIDPSI